MYFVESLNSMSLNNIYALLQEITWLDFHPTEQILASGSKDFTIKIFDFSKPSAKKATRNINVNNNFYLLSVKFSILFF